MHRKRLIPTLLASLVVLAFAPIEARASEDNAGTTAANFLSVGSGAGIQGRGGATLGLWGDLTMVGWNPGALGWLRETEIAFAHATLLEEHTQDYMALGGRFGRSSVRWSLSGLYENEGTFESRDEFNNPIGSFGVSRFAGGGHVAFPLGPSAALGVGGKWVNENLGDSQGAGVTFDLGLHFRSGAFGFGAAAQNAFGEMKFGEQSFDFPTNYGAGVAWSHRPTGLRVAVDANFPNAYYTDVRGGLEWRWRNMLALRGGYRSELGAPDGEALTGPTFGMGAGAYGMWLDYAYIGVSLRPGRMSGGAFAAVAPSDDIWSDDSPAVDPAVEPDAKLPPREPKVEQPKAPKPAKVEKPRAPKPAKTKPVEAPQAGEALPPTAAPSGVQEAPASPPPAEAAPAPTPVKQPKAEKPKVEKPKPAPKAAAPKAEPPAPAEVAPATPAKQPKVEAPKPQAPAAPAVRPATIKVKPGETLEMLAKQWGVSVPALMMENDLVSTTVKPGQTLKLPAKGR
jgi:LysM repeat protein